MKLNLNPLSIRGTPTNIIRFANEESYTVTDDDIVSFPGCIRLIIKPARPPLIWNHNNPKYAFSLKGL